MAVDADEITLPQLECPAASADEPKQARLHVVFAPGEVPDSAILRPSEHSLLIGRTARSGLALEDPRLSRVHFRVAWDGRSAGFRATDARSMNGLFVNGARRSSAVLRHGDVIRAGDSLFVFETEQDIAALHARVERVGPTERNVLLLGETGSGKEVFARRLHEKSGRRGALVGVNCAAIPKDLIAPELFGHARGAFSGAVQAREGLFRAADQGTLFLDEVGDLPLDMQPALLRALEERVVRPLGTNLETPTSARVIAATHVDLRAAQTAGKFREDLFARLAQVVLSVPPLRHRRSEILALARGFTAAPLQLSATAAEALLLWRWPRNVRELRSLIETFAAVEPASAVLDVSYLRSAEPAIPELLHAARSKPDTDNAQPGPTIPRGELQALLARHGGNVSAVAHELGKVRAQVYRWMQAYGISTDTLRAGAGAARDAS